VRVAWNAQKGDVIQFDFAKGWTVSYEVIDTTPHGVIVLTKQGEHAFLSYFGLFEREARYLHKVS